MSPVDSPSLRRELRTSARLAAPLTLGHLSSGLIGFVDASVAGHHGTGTLAGVSVGNALFWLPMLVPMGTLMSIPPHVSELDGAGNHQAIARVFRQSVWIALVLGVLMFGFLRLAATLLPQLGIATDVVPPAQAFLRGISYGIPAFTLYLCMRYLSDGLHFTLPTMVLGFGGLLVLAPLGYALTFGRFGLPALGAKGLGLASAGMMWMQACAFAVLLVKSRRFAVLHLFARWEWPHAGTIGMLLKTGLPIGVTVAMEGGLFITTSLLIGRLGAIPAAAHQVAINVASLCFMIPLGLAEATTVRVGHALGRGDGDGLRRAIRAGYTLLVITQTLSALVLVLGRHLIVQAYTQEAAVAALAAQLLLFAVLFQYPDGVQVISAGALRGLKDTRVPMLLAAFAYWGIGMPVGAGLGLGLGHGPQGMWIGLTAGLLVAALLLAWRVWRPPGPPPLPTVFHAGAPGAAAHAAS